MKNKTKQHQYILDAVQYCRLVTLDTVERAMQGDAVWPAVRSTLLRAFGDIGLTGQVNRAFDCEFSRELRGDK